MRRKEPVVHERFQKDAAQEDFLARLNQILEPHDRQWELPGRVPHPTVHIVGPPRSGTTFLNQLICHYLDIGYIDNLTAAFWRAPLQGILLSRKLLRGHAGSNFQSEFGRTHAIHEPHEFGYFWSSHLRYADMDQQSESHARSIDWVKLSDLLQRMTRAYDRPILFKPLLLTWHLRDFQRVMPDACFIRLRRDPVDNAMSLLKARTEFLKNSDQWLSLRPLACHGLEAQPVWHQVAAQVHHLELWLNEQTSRLRNGSVLDLCYEDICRGPASTVERVRTFLSSQGMSIAQTTAVTPNCVRPKVSETRTEPEAEWITQLLSQWGPTNQPSRKRRPDAA